MTKAQEVLDWPLWVYPTSTGGHETINYIGCVPDDWLTESWYVKVDFTGGPKTVPLYVTIQDRHTQFSVTDVILIMALNPAAYAAISQVDVTPSVEGSKDTTQFLLVNNANVPRGVNPNQHIYKKSPPPQCYFYEFHVSNSLGKRGSTNPSDHVDLTVTLHINSGITSSEGIYVHFDCSAVLNSAIVINPFSHDVNTIAACPGPVHNVAAIGQTATPTVVTQGEHVNIQVTVQNRGTQTESFDVTCYFNTSIVGTLPVNNLAVGQSKTLSFDWNTEGVLPGTYSIKAWADSGGVITETDEADNWCTSCAIVTVKVHDVAATSQVPNMASVAQGATVNIDVTVQNLGNFTETFAVTCYYDSTAIGTKTVTCLAPSALKHVFFDWNTAGVAPSVYHIRTVADSGNAIAEANETNNECTSIDTVTVCVPAQPGKLFVDKAETAVISGPDPPVVGFATTYELTITVTNTGGQAVTNVVVEDTISSDVAFVSVETLSQGFLLLSPPPIKWSVGTLASAASATLKFRVSVTPSARGTLYLNHKESLKAYGCTDSTNIEDCGDTDVKATSILRDVAALSQVASPTTVVQGEPVSIDVTVKNQGDETESFYVICYYDSSPIGKLRACNLAPGNSLTLTFAWDTRGIPVGTYNIKAKADSDDELAESVETNNECTAIAQVKVMIHDVAAISQTPSPTVVHAGEPVTIDVVLQNQGTEPETFDVKCYYGGNQIGNAQSVTSLQPSASKTLTFNWDTTGVASGIYDITAIASTVPGETDITDNFCMSVARVTVYAPGSPGILYVDKAETAVVSGPNPPVVGQTTVYDLTIMVTNTGDWDITDVIVQDVISGDVTYVGIGIPSKGSATYVSPKITWNVGTLTHGEIETLTFRVSVAPTTVGLRYLNCKGDLSASGKTDSTSVSDEGHNDVTANAIVQDVTACSQVPSKLVVNQGETVSIDVEVENLGDQTESFDTTCYYDSTQITPHGKVRASTLGPGDSTILTFSWDTTGVAPGTYSIRAVADSSGEISESDETNNECHDYVTVKIEIHDVAAVSQNQSPTTVQVGGTVIINVQVQNQGTEPETFTVKCYYDSSQIGAAQAVTNLAPGASETLTFTWITTGVTPGTYYISATASTVSGETDTSDNTCPITTTVTVTIAGPGELCVDKAKTAVISGPDPPQVGKTTVYELTMTVKNTGGSDVTGILVQDTISSSVTYVSVGTPSQGSATYVAPNIAWNVGTLHAGDTATLTFRASLTPATTGVKYLNDKEDLLASGLTDSTIVSDFGDTDVTVWAVSALGSGPPVGGEWVLVNRPQLPAPWTSLASLLIAAMVSILYNKHRKKPNS